MFVSVDIGNTAIKITAFSDKGEVMKRETESSLEDAMLEVKELRPTAVGYCTTRRLSEEEEERISGQGWWHLHKRSVDLPVGINYYKTPETLGEDRLAAMIGARVCSPGRAIGVIDAGTAVTFDLVSRKGYFEGGNISPGLSMRFRALHEFTSRLPLVNEEGPIPLVGNATSTAIRAGVVRGLVLEVCGMMETASRRSDSRKFFLTGGNAEYLEAKIRETFHMLFNKNVEMERNYHLVAIGIKEAYRYNHGK